MKYSKGKVSDIQVAYIGGGSRGWAWTFMTDLALEDEISGIPFFLLCTIMNNFQCYH